MVVKHFFCVVIKGLKSVNVVFALFWEQITGGNPYRHLDGVTSCKHMAASLLNFGS